MSQRSSTGIVSLLILLSSQWNVAFALPPPTEIPEEVLRAKVDLGARSPIDNQPLSSTELLALQEALAAQAPEGSVSPEVEQLIFLLKLRKGFRDLFPFLF
ncbi:MAG: hypothetical protein ACUVRV_09150 [Cyanobacteriota bacterium]